jgi:hypothetical protein
MCIGSRVAALLISALNNSMHSPCKTDLSIILPDLFFVHQPGYSTGEISLETSIPYHRSTDSSGRLWKSN